MLSCGLIATTWLIISPSLGHIFRRFVRRLRIASSAPNVFVQSIVWAEMRKSVSYRVDISLNEDGIIQETQCECGAGQGPSADCKHVVTVLSRSDMFHCHCRRLDRINMHPREFIDLMYYTSTTLNITVSGKPHLLICKCLYIAFLQCVYFFTQSNRFSICSCFVVWVEYYCYKQTQQCMHNDLKRC